MKKTCLFALLALALAFTACKKDEDENNNVQNRKIDKIYTEWAYYRPDADSWVVQKHLSEVWEWDGEQLKSISYYNDGGFYESKASFSYQNNKLDNIMMSNNTGDTGMWKYIYQNGMLVSVLEYVNSEQVADIQLAYTGNNVTKIAYTRNDLAKGNATTKPLLNPIFYIDASLYHKLLTYTERENNSKDWSGTYVYELEWEQGNCIRLKATLEGDTDVEDYIYDNKINPFHSSFFGQHDPGHGVNLYSYCFPTSPNNISICKTSTTYGYEVIEAYTYTYDGEYPIVLEKNLQSYTIDGVPQNWQQREVVYFEYK